MPNLVHLKWVGLIAAFLAVFYMGHHFGKADGDRRAAEAETAAAIADKVHANDLLTLQAKHQTILIDAVAQNSAKYQAETKRLKDANAQYQKRIGEINAARINAGTRVAAIDGGMWMDVETATCTGPSGSHSGGSAEAGTGTYDLRGPQTSRCKLSPASAEFLVSLTSEADTLAEKFNLCRNEVRTVNTDQPLELKPTDSLE